MCEAYLKRDVGPETTTVGTPSVPATCIGPLSFVNTMSDAQIIENISGTENPHKLLGNSPDASHFLEKTAQTSKPSSFSR